MSYPDRNTRRNDCNEMTGPGLEFALRLENCLPSTLPPKPFIPSVRCSPGKPSLGPKYSSL
jgi:hypothetical protein